jgi:hypothetical protein
MADRLRIPNIGAVDDAGLTIYPNGPAKPPLELVWSWGLNTFGYGGIDAHYPLKHCKGLAVLHDPASYAEGGEAGIKLAYSEAGKKLAAEPGAALVPGHDPEVMARFPSYGDESSGLAVRVG